MNPGPTPRGGCRRQGPGPELWRKPHRGLPESRGSLSLLSRFVFKLDASFRTPAPHLHCCPQPTSGTCDWDGGPEERGKLGTSFHPRGPEALAQAPPCLMDTPRPHGKPAGAGSGTWPLPCPLVNDNTHGLCDRPSPAASPGPGLILLAEGGTQGAGVGAMSGARPEPHPRLWCQRTDVKGRGVTLA